MICFEIVLKYKFHTKRTSGQQTSLQYAHEELIVSGHLQWFHNVHSLFEYKILNLNDKGKNKHNGEYSFLLLRNIEIPKSVLKYF